MIAEEGTKWLAFRYVVMYGWSSFLAKLDGVDAPPHPKVQIIYCFMTMTNDHDVRKKMTR